MHELVKTQSMPIQNMADLATAGTMLAQSGMFGAKNPAEGFVIAVTCHQENMSLMDFMRTYHLVEGRPAMKSDAMLAGFKRNGGTYTVIERTPEAAELLLEKDGQTLRDRFTWAEAQKERYVYCKDGKTLKDNWSSPRKIKQMLWARVVSDLVRVLDPTVNAGSYTPEEVQDFEPQNQPNPQGGKVIDPVEAAKKINPEPVNAEPVAAAPVENTQPPQGAKTEPEQKPAIDPVVPAGTKQDEVPRNQPQMTQQTAEPDPFSETPVNPEICPLSGPMKGVEWASMTNENLQAASQVKHELMTPTHHDTIKRILKFRKEKGINVC
jgi:hypothetical protein